jgi:hypothetical protein
MSQIDDSDDSDDRIPRSEPEPAGSRTLTPEAQRALAEAEARRRAAASAAAAPPEYGGRDGPDPARYGDWEKDGITSDF